MPHVTPPVPKSAEEAVLMVVRHRLGFLHRDQPETTEEQAMVEFVLTELRKYMPPDKIGWETVLSTSAIDAAMKAIAEKRGLN